MKKSTMAFITATTILATVACAKKSAKNPTAKPDAKVDSAAQIEAARAKKEAEERAKAQGLNPASPRTDKTSPGIPGTPRTRPAVQPPRDSQPPLDQGDQETKQDYVGPLLVIQYPNTSHSAWIPIADEDAKAIYTALRLKARDYPENDTFLPGKVKSGENIRCFLQFEKSAPDVEQYSCNIHVGYSTGEVELANANVDGDFDDAVPVLKKKYSGVSVLLTPATVNIPTFDPSAEMKITGDGFGAANAKDLLKVHGEPVGRLKLTGNDARAFYNLMKVPVIDGTATEAVPLAKKKTGQNISCVKYQPAAKNEPTFRCDMKFNYSNGKIQQLASPRLPEESVAEDKAEEKTEVKTEEKESAQKSDQKPAPVNRLDPNAIVSSEGE